MAEGVGRIIYDSTGTNAADVNGSNQLAVQDPPAMGEVQATPTANTLLGRLKDIYDAIVARLGVLGQNTKANSSPFVLASDQISVTDSNNTAAIGDWTGGAGGSWTGVGTDTLAYSHILVTVDTDINGGFIVQFSEDGSTRWKIPNAYSFTYLTANGRKAYVFPIYAQWYRLAFSGSGQPAPTRFNVTARLTLFPPRATQNRVGTPMLEDDSAEVVKAAIVGRNGSSFLDILTEDDGRLLVSAAASPPPDTTPVLVDVAGTVSTSSDEFYVIPNAAQLYVQQMSGSGQSDVDGTEVVLYYDPNGDLSVLTRIATGVVSGNTFNITLSYKVPDVGDGTRRMVLRRNRLSGGGIFVEASFRGYYE